MPFDPNRRPWHDRLSAPTLRPVAPFRTAAGLALALAAIASSLTPASAESAHSYLVFDARTGEVIDKYNAHRAWYPASVTKLMTAYVTFQAIRAGRLKMTSPVVQSAEAASQPPSKMGFPVGTVVTVDNALKIIMVKSANDVSWALGEAVSGSKDEFVEEMNRQARRLGMSRTTWGNPNGLPDPTQVTNAHDLALLARALIREFPEHAGYFKLPGIQFGKRIMRNHNALVDRFPGTDGMKTGFICSSGFNVVASVTRGNRRLIAVVLGAPNARIRAEKTAELFTKAFDGSGGIAAFFGGRETVDGMTPGPEAALPVADIREDVCGRNRRNVGEDADDFLAAAPVVNEDPGAVIPPGQSAKGRRNTPSGPVHSYLTVARLDVGPPVKVWTGGADPLPAGTAVAAAGTSGPAPTLVVPTPKPGVTDSPNVTALVEPARPAAPGAIFPGAGRSEPVPTVQPGGVSATARAFSLFSNKPPGTIPVPATGPESGAGVAESLAPATGTPMVIAGPTPAGQTAEPSRRAAAPIAADLPIPTKKPRPPASAAAKPNTKAAAKAPASAQPTRKKK